MISLPPFEILTLVPFAGLIDKFVLDFDILDLVLWYPRLSWGEFSRALGAVFACKLVSDQMERWALAPIKRRAKAKLAEICHDRWPSIALRLNSTPKPNAD